MKITIASGVLMVWVTSCSSLGTSPADTSSDTSASTGDHNDGSNQPHGGRNTGGAPGNLETPSDLVCLTKGAVLPDNNNCQCQCDQGGALNCSCKGTCNTTSANCLVHCAAGQCTSDDPALKDCESVSCQMTDETDLTDSALRCVALNCKKVEPPPPPPKCDPKNPPKLLTVLDRSCSMQKPPTGASTKEKNSMKGSKWDFATTALKNMASTYGDQLELGLTMFPDQTGAECSQGDIPLPVAKNNKNAFINLLDTTQPNDPCVTNIDTAMQQVLQDPAIAGASAQNPAYVVLVTDGKQSSQCGGDSKDPTTEATIKKLQQMGIKTFVVGFDGSGTEIDPAALNAFAVAGGTQRAATAPFYYQANNSVDLEAALKTIAGQVTTCE